MSRQHSHQRSLRARLPLLLWPSSLQRLLLLRLLRVLLREAAAGRCLGTMRSAQRCQQQLRQQQLRQQLLSHQQQHRSLLPLLQQARLHQQVVLHHLLLLLLLLVSRAVQESLRVVHPALLLVHRLLHPRAAARVANQ
jgi:hypothetical protein